MDNATEELARMGKRTDEPLGRLEAIPHWNSPTGRNWPPVAIESILTMISPDCSFDDSEATAMLAPIEPNCFDATERRR